MINKSIHKQMFLLKKTRLFEKYTLNVHINKNKVLKIHGLMQFTQWTFNQGLLTQGKQKQFCSLGMMDSFHFEWG